MAKYAAKSEPPFQSASEILSLYVNRPRNTDMATSALRRAMIQIAGERDLGSQETARMLLWKPLYSSTYSFLCVSSYNGDEHEDDNSDDYSEEEPATMWRQSTLWWHNLTRKSITWKLAVLLDRNCLSNATSSTSWIFQLDHKTKKRYSREPTCWR